ncbi:unnamed protein product [Oikopleura dioica]|uniref:Uncharacterized protein n=1 Tax=Oikopleura dioica TaxID=34765 RepID=E4YUS4_OIKDI|nr:unnamed protein product [Oikopleura dioica]
MVVGVSNQRVEVLTRFYAGEQFPFSKIYGFGGTDKLKDVHLTFKEILAAKEHLPTSWFSDIWSCLTADRSLFILRFPSPANFVLAFTYASLDWMLARQSFGAFENLSPNRPVSIVLVSSLTQKKLIISFIKKRLDNLPILISTAEDIIARISSKALFVDSVEKIVIEDPSSFLDLAAVHKIIKRVKQAVETTDGVGIDNLNIYLDSTRAFPEFIEIFNKKDSLFITNNLIEAHALQKTEVILSKSPIIPEVANDSFFGSKFTINDFNPTTSSIDLPQFSSISLTEYPENADKIKDMLIASLSSPFTNTKSVKLAFTIKNGLSDARYKRIHDLYLQIMRRFPEYKVFPAKLLNSPLAQRPRCLSMLKKGFCEAGAFTCRAKNKSSNHFKPKVEKNDISGERFIVTKINDVNEITVVAESSLPLIFDLSSRLKKLMPNDQNARKFSIGKEFGISTLVSVCHLFNGQQIYARGRVQETEIRRDRFHNIICSVKLLDTDEILEIKQEDVEIAPENEFGEDAILIISSKVIFPGLKLASLAISQEACLFLMKLLEYKNEKVNLKSIAILDGGRVIYVDDIFFQKRISLSLQLIQEKYAVIDIDERQRIQMLFAYGHEEFDKKTERVIEQWSSMEMRTDTEIDTLVHLTPPNLVESAKVDEKQESNSFFDFIETQDEAHASVRESATLQEEEIKEESTEENEASTNESPEDPSTDTLLMQNIEMEVKTMDRSDQSSFEEVKTPQTVENPSSTDQDSIELISLDTIHPSYSTLIEFETDVGEAIALLCKDEKEVLEKVLQMAEKGCFDELDLDLALTLQEIIEDDDEEMVITKYLLIAFTKSFPLWQGKNELAARFYELMLSKSKTVDGDLREQILLALVDIFEAKNTLSQKLFACQILQVFQDSIYDSVDEENVQHQSLQSYLRVEEFNDFACFLELWKRINLLNDASSEGAILECVNHLCVIFVDFGRDFSDEERNVFGIAFVDDWVAPLLSHLSSKPSLPEHVTKIYGHVTRVLKETLKRCCFDPIVERLVPLLPILRTLNDEFSKIELNNQFALKIEQNAGLNGIFGAVIKHVKQAKTMIAFRKMSGAVLDVNLRFSNDEFTSISFNWLEHRGWIQMKTDLPREVVQIVSYDFELNDEKNLSVFIRDSNGRLFSQTITLLQKVKNVRIAAVSARVLKIRINKHDREKWGKASQLRNSFFSRDLEGSWSDFENTDDEEEDWNDQVPPDEEEFDEIEDDDFSAHADHE